MVKSAFHFSPRANRAHEIHWREWGEKAFAEAIADRKLILLAISGVWCHWCHVMDEKTYSDPDIIKLLNTEYIPVRVDTDQRPDVNARYNMGGWPTTALLTPEGFLVTGGTYMPPEELKPLLKRASQLYKQEPEAFRIRDDRQKTSRPEPAADLSLEVYEEVAEALLQEFDPLYGGFGKAPKFPMVEAIELALNLHYVSGKEEYLNVALTSLDGMAGGGMYDHIEGGFFRYSTTRDWLIPHYEKMLEDNAGLLGVLLQAFQVSAEQRYLDIARDVVRYLENNLYQQGTGCWSGTQDADEEYYSTGAEERGKMDAPYIDRHIYTDWNGVLARSLFLMSWVTGEHRWARLGTETLGFLFRRAYRQEDGMAHVVDLDGVATLFGRLDDQVEVGRACLAAYQTTGDDRWLKHARDLAEFLLKKLKAPDGGFYDGVSDPGAPGALAVPIQDPQANARAVRFLVALEAFGSEHEYRSQGQAALRATLGDFRRYGTLASGMALAVFESLAALTVVTLVGNDNQETYELHRTALRVYKPAKYVRLLVAGKHDNVILQDGYDLRPDAKSRAYVCVGQRCLPPIDTREELITLLRDTKSLEDPVAELVH